jgi:hypothetical protein
MAYDSARGRLVLFGGWGDGYSLDDAWEWDGATWVERERTAGPSSRSSSAMAYDSVRNRLVLFGGGSPSFEYLGDTWEWNGRSWVERTSAASPSARCCTAMAYDAARGRVVLFGGYDDSQSLADTWEWDGSTWVERTPTTSPPAVASHAMAYDSARGRVVLFAAGESAGTTWEWDGSDWIERSPPTSPPGRYGHAMAYDSARGRVVLFGGHSSGYFGDTWEWDGSIWIERAPATSPPARGYHAMAYDIARGRVVLFGGDLVDGEPAFDTWEWDGNAWVERFPSTRPTARTDLAMAYDEARGRVILFGGWEDATLGSDMWEYGPIDACSHASSVVAFTRGSGTDDTSALAALGAPDSVAVSVGLAGSLGVRIDPPIPNAPGADLIVHEIGSRHGGLDDNFHVEVSEDGIVYRSAGNCSGDECQLDLAGSDLSSARYVRLVDLAPDEGEPAPDAGADIDAVSVVACDACALVDGGADSDSDGTANGCDACPFVNDDQLDTDGDGAGDACDCAPADPATRPSAAVLGVIAAKLVPDAVRLSWPQAAGADGYAVTRSLLSEVDADSFGDCLEPLQAAGTLDDAAIPPVGNAFVYLIQGVDATCGIGTLGPGAGGVERINTDPQACM